MIKANRGGFPKVLQKYECMYVQMHVYVLRQGW